MRRIGPIAAQRRPDGLLLGSPTAHPVYGANYVVEPVPSGLSPDELRAYVGRSGWYHQIDLGNGVLTPGMKSVSDIGREWDLFALGDLAGRSVLDIGGIDGAYAFLAEKHGAGAVAVLDHYLWSTDADQYSAIYEEHRAAGTIPPAPHESVAWQPETTPTRWRFDAARQILNSRVRAMPFDFADCDLGAVGQWDVVLFLGVLYHMTDPVGIMRRLASVTRQQAIIETQAILIRDRPEPLWSFYPGGDLNHDRTNWWAPNMGGLLGLIGAAGFSNAEVLTGEPDLNTLRGDGPHGYRAIVRAIK
jgi:tRNA (mo5U34)-methyltransferase